MKYNAAKNISSTGCSLLSFVPVWPGLSPKQGRFINLWDQRYFYWKEKDNITEFHYPNLKATNLVSNINMISSGVNIILMTTII